MAKSRAESDTESRLSIRVDAARKAVTVLAAKQQGEMLRDFVLDNAFRMATELLADEGTVSPGKKQIAHIFETLDNPPAKRVAAVRKLLSVRPILEG